MFLYRYDFIASIENGDWRKTCARRVEEIEKILNENKDLKFVFDFAHALTICPEDIPKYINKFKDKIVEIHLSFIESPIRKHSFLHKKNGEKIRFLLKPLKKVTVPFILEYHITNQNQIPLIQKDIEYIRSL